ncbi:MAG: hypothetical protein H0V01_01245 [Bacteroidetes bacterium]|nr:hypothetical protein [Bacteroidota bacterium]HET6243165.1 hypothetical protein [Bacteroidia bacterium]
MEPAKNIKILENTNSTSWMDEKGIIYSVSKKAPQPTIEQSKKDLDEFRKQFGEGKFCFLMDISESTPSSREARDYAAEELKK